MTASGLAPHPWRTHRGCSPNRFATTSCMAVWLVALPHTLSLISRNGGCVCRCVRQGLQLQRLEMHAIASVDGSDSTGTEAPGCAKVWHKPIRIMTRIQYSCSHPVQILP